MTAGLRFDHYEWAGGHEAMLRFGPDEKPVVVLAQPLFEEANRTRALLVAVMRGLADHGIASTLPDLPGQGESPIPTVDARLTNWRLAFAAATAWSGEHCYSFAVRGGALVDGDAEVAARLHLAPQQGKTLVRDLLRARRAAAIAEGERPTADDPSQPGPPLLLAGNLLDRELIQALVAAEPSRADRVLAVFPEAQSADRDLAPAWNAARQGDRPRFRRPWAGSEPFAEVGLVAMLIDEIVSWIRACDG